MSFLRQKRQKEKEIARDPTSGLELGLELDRLMAERLMGWRVEQEAVFGYSVWEDKAGHERASEDLAGDLDWSPSSDISAAWDIVQAMEDRGWQLLIFSSKGANREEEKKWAAVFFRQGLLKHLDHLVTAPSAPLAISRAAYFALREEEADGPGGETWP